MQILTRMLLLGLAVRLLASARFALLAPDPSEAAVAKAHVRYVH